jgi:hypothetical protein
MSADERSAFASMRKGLQLTPSERAALVWKSPKIVRHYDEFLALKAQIARVSRSRTGYWADRIAQHERELARTGARLSGLSGRRPFGHSHRAIRGIELR